MAAGRPEPIVPRPPELIQRFGLSNLCTAPQTSGAVRHRKSRWHCLRHFPERLDRLLRLDFFTVIRAVAAAVIGSPFIDLFHQEANASPSDFLRIHQRAKSFLSVRSLPAQQWGRRQTVFEDGRRVDIDMNDFGPTKLPRRVRHHDHQIIAPTPRTNNRFPMGCRYWI